ncbi:ion channel CASTOR-like isoform X2 [Papaver somniferum]|uniref:ion channel CASTOR-like isoform X2 n=1 Tax=Papaver somniferum TaxID=3469 RepID=UPI000E701E8A|nr:ion channel CASTOR-like isoform X2 [Papaver somniferum]
MSFMDPDQPSSSCNRDWFFPSPSFIHSTHPTPTSRTLKPPKKFYSSARRSGSQKIPYPLEPPLSQKSTPILPLDNRYGGIPRRIDFDRTRDKMQRSDDETIPTEKKNLVEEKTTTIVGRLKSCFRWNRRNLVFPVILTIFFYLLRKNFNLQGQVKDSEEQILILKLRLQECNLPDSVHIINSNAEENFISTESLRTLALIFSLLLLSTPFLIFKYVDYVSKTRRSSKEVSLNKQLEYHVDVFLSVHPYTKPSALLIATLLLIFIGGVALFGVTDDGLADCLWLSWTYVASSGNHADSEGIGPRLVSISISFGGMLIFAMMLGLVSDAISEKLDSLRKGKSEVVESSHTLILGWSEKLGTLLNQLVIANESLGGGTVVVMAERDKEEMELDIAKMEFDFRETSVICRSGNPCILADLKKVSVSKARAIIVLAEDGNADQSDARALRTVLSLTGVKEGLRGHIVVELSDLDNEVLVKLVGGELVETVVAHDVIGRLMIQCARQPGLAQIWEDILGFENCEFYIKRWPGLDGMCFEDVLISFADAIPCGVKSVACGGKIILNPDDSYVLQEGDEVLVIAEDDDTYAPTTLPMVKEASLIEIIRPTKEPQKILLCGWRRDIDDMIVKLHEKILFCGWRRDMEDMIMVLDAFLAPESELWMFNEVPENDRVKKLTDGGLDFDRLMNITLVHREGNAVIRRNLESLPLETFDSILILADESVEDSAIQADSRSLATLLLIRDIQAKRLPYSKETPIHRGAFSKVSWMGEMQQASDKSVIISEILDPRTKNLLSMSKISDYVLSNELVSMALAMVAEDRQINDVLEELFAEEGNEMHIRQANLYLHEEEELNFFEVLLRARQRKEIVIGYRLANAERAVINPPNKSERRNWSSKDAFVVIAEKE